MISLSNSKFNLSAYSLVVLMPQILREFFLSCAISFSQKEQNGADSMHISP